MDSHEAAALGIARTFQNIALFKGMTVLDNVMTGRNLRWLQLPAAGALFWAPPKREELDHRRAAEEIIDFLEIQHMRKTPVGAPAVRPAEARRALAARSPPSRSSSCWTSRWPA